MLMSFFPKQKAKSRRASLVHSDIQVSTLCGECVQYCACTRRCLWRVCVRKRFPTNAAHNTFACYITTPIRPSLSPSLPNLNSFISLSLFNKAPIHCPANQSLHSCSQLSMTRFIWLGPCPSHQPSSFSILLVWNGHGKPDYHSMSHTKSRGLHEAPAYNHFTYRPGQTPTCKASCSDISA